MENVLFYFFSSLAIFGALMVIRSENPIHSLLFLVLVFTNGAALLLLLEVEFMAMLFILVYVGAVSILFLFVLMILDLKIAYLSTLDYLPVGGILFLLFLVEIFLLLPGDFGASLGEGQTFLPVWSSLIDKVTNMGAIGLVLYTYYFYFFGMSSLILLVGMIGAILLAMEMEGRYKVRRQQIFQQVSRSFEKAVFLSQKTTRKND